MVLTSFSWPYGGRHAALCGSFTGWRECLMVPIGSEFQVVFDLPPGVYQYRFLVDGTWRCDEQERCVRSEYGVSNEIIVEDHTTTVVHPEPYVTRNTNTVDGIYLTTEPLLQTTDAQIMVFRRWVSDLLLGCSIFDIIPESSKVAILDVELPVKQAFHIMHIEGLALVPLWDDHRKSITGLLTASDFVLILRNLQKNIRILGHEELEMHSIAIWKEAKLQLYRRADGAAGMLRRPLVHVDDLACLMDVAMKIVKNEISAVPIFKSVLEEPTSMPLLNLASLPGILKYLCSKFREQIEEYPFLQYQISSIPMGTWLPNACRGSKRQLVILRRDAPLNSTLDLLLEARVSSIPIVEDNGSLRDVYSLCDIMAMAKNDIYSRIQLEQVTVEHALELVYQVNGRRQCHTCFGTNTFLEVSEKLSCSGVRRLVVVDPRTRFVEGIISLRDVFTFLLGHLM